MTSLRTEAEVSVVASLKYLVNHFFEMYGIEVHVLVIAWARVPHVGYWHSSGLEPEGRRSEGSKPLQ